MGFIHGLAVALIIFKGIIIQCKGTAPLDTTSLNWIQDAQIIDINGDQPFLPNHLIEVIISKSDFKTVQTTIRSRIINATNTVLSKILRDRIIVIMPHDFDGNTREYYEDGDLFLRFGSYRGLVSLFDQFGDLVKKIEIRYADTSSSVLRTQIHQNIINRYANNLEELRITMYHHETRHDDGLWEEILSNGENGILFPEVKKFQFRGGCYRNEFKLNLIFPKLESFKLIGNVNDANCLANITTLKELKLRTTSIQEHQFDHIFANNKNLAMISLAWTNRAETMHAIAKDLTKLETLEVRFPLRNFLFRSNNAGLYNLSSVIHFDVSFFGINDLIGELSFEMPHLKKLSLKGTRIDDRIIHFINYFKELETVEILVRNYNPVECIVKLRHIKEFMVNNFENSQLYSLRKMFESFDEKSKLQTLKLWLVDNDSHQRYERAMKGINNRLENSKKPTWTLSHGEQNKTGRKYLMFKRER